VTNAFLHARPERMLHFLTYGILATAVGGCASIAGLDQYAGGSSNDASVPAPNPPSPGLDAAGSDRAALPESRWAGDEPSGDEAAPADEVQEPPVGTGDTGAGDAGGADAGVEAGGDATLDGPVERLPDGSPGPDASDARPPPCTSTSCGGCCSAAGDCVGGQSAATCGTAGAACVDCSARGQSCNAGVCSSTPHDAGACTMLSCTTFTNLCIPVWQQPCCKVDGTCGCYITIPTGPCR